jgi:CheY-like chemotaxis protein
MMLDDEVSVSNFIGEVLRDHGYDVAIFSESPTAMRYLEAHRDEVAMILTDQMMPLMTGLELSEQAERHSKPGGTPGCSAAGTPGRGRLSRLP